MTCSQSILYPVAGIGGPASALGKVNNAPTIASAKKPLRSCCLMFCLFIIFQFSFLVLAFSDCSSLRIHFRPFTDVLRKNLGSLTQKVWISYRRKRRQRRISQTVWNFLQKVTKRTKIFGAAEDKAFVSFVIFCLESSPVLRAPTLPGAPRHPPSHSFGVEA